MSPLNFEIINKQDKVILIYSPCRSGSTPLLNALSMLDDQEGFYQPIKAALRRSIAKQEEPVIIDAQAPTIIIKETLGPYFREEVDYDPISVLIENGIPPSALHIIALFRQPEACLFSWQKNFRPEDVNFSLFGPSYSAVYDDCAAAQKRGIHVIPLRYEDLGDSQIFQAMLAELEVSFNPAMLDWKLSKKYKPGEYAFALIKQPYLDDQPFRDMAQSDGFVVRQSSIIPSFSDARAEVSGLASARDIYMSKMNELVSAERRDANTRLRQRKFDLGE